MGYAFLADLVVAFHVAYVSFIVFGELIVVLGALLRWTWVRNLWFRVLHLLAIAIVAAEALASIACPLTVWEDRLRRAAGQDVSDGTFIGRCLHNILFYDLPPWAFTAAYIGFALVVLLTLVLAPPRRRPAFSA